MNLNEPQSARRPRSRAAAGLDVSVQRPPRSRPCYRAPPGSAASSTWVARCRPAVPARRLQAARGAATPEGHATALHAGHGEAGAGAPRQAAKARRSAEAVRALAAASSGAAWVCCTCSKRSSPRPTGAPQGWAKGKSVWPPWPQDPRYASSTWHAYRNSLNASLHSKNQASTSTSPSKQAVFSSHLRVSC